MKNALRIFAIFLFSFFIFNQAQAYITKSGDVSGEYWASGTYYIDGNLTVNAGSTLQIQAGARIKIAPQVYFTVYGTIQATGTDISSVIFTSRDDDTVGEIILESDGVPNPGDWHGIYLNGSNADGIGEFDHCWIRYGGYSFGVVDANIRFHQSTSGHFNNSTSEYSAGDGILANICSIDISGSSFINNTGYAAKLDNVTIKNYPNNSASGNGFNVFGINGTVTENLTWTQFPSSVILSLTGQVVINDNIVCTIPEGTIIKSNNTGYFYVRGTLDVNGSASNSVVITSIKDDSYGGDSNNDGATTNPSPGDWIGIYFYGNGDNDGIGEFDYCRVRYGGLWTGQADANIFFSFSDAGHFTNSFSEFSSQDGIKTANTSIDISGSSFENNTDYAAFLFDVTSIKNYPNNSASGNGTNAFGVEGDVSENLSWTNTTSSVILSLVGRVTVEDDIVCTIPEGTIIKSNSTGNFYVKGTLDVNGTLSNPVVITSLKDDNYGGDTNNDSDASIPAPGDWHGIYLYGIGTNDGIGEFDYCRVRYGGYYSGNADANINFVTSNSGHFVNSYSEFSSQDGIKTANTSIDISGSSFENNTDYAAFLNDVPSIKNYANNSVSGNGINAFGIYGQVTENLTWTETASSVILSLTGRVTVEDDIVCTIPEGTIIKSNSTGNFYVQGTLDVNGTVSNPVILTSLKDDTYGGDTNNDGDATTPAPGDWHGIYLNGNAADDGIGEFDYCRVRYGGYYGGSPKANIYFYLSDSGHFTNSFCEYSSEDGIKTANCTIDISESNFIGNTDYAALLNSVPSIKNYPNNSATGNGIDAFGIYGHVTENLTWTNTFSSVILSLTGQVRVYDDIVCTIPEGTIIKSNSAGNLYVNGSLDVNGTVSNPVVITSLQDDTYGGDINNDGSASQPAPGDWHGIYLNGDGDDDGIGEFDYCRVRYGGYYSGSADANIYFYLSDSGHFTNSFCEYSSEDGIKTTNTSIDISGSSFENNTDYAALLNAVPSIKNYPNNTVSENGIDAFGISGQVSENLTWTNTSSSVILSLIGQVRIFDDIVCTLPEGTIIKSNNAGNFYVEGTLDVNGTVSNPVVITSLLDDTYGGDINNDVSASQPAPGDWHGIYLSGNDDDDGIGEFDYCRIRYGGYSNGNAKANISFYLSDSGHFANSYCEYSAEEGIKTTNCTIDISESNFIGNADYAALLNAVPSIKNFPNNTVSENGIDAFGISGQVSENLTWTNTSSSVILSIISSVSINDDIVCTIPEGTIIKSSSAGSFYVRGTLDVNGTISNPVVITSLKDDSYGGDTNNDGDVTTPAPGDWHGIYLNGNADNDGIGEFDYCRIRYGGYTYGNAKADIYFYHSDSGHFTNSFCEYSAEDGIKTANCTIDISENNFIGNTEYAALLIAVPSIKNYPNNTVSGNGIDAFGISGQVIENLTWTNTTTSVILSLISSVSINDDIVCTIPEGTIIKVDNSCDFYVRGTLDVNGTISNPVVITSLKDDTFGGDTNNDGDASIPAPGDWNGIYLNGNTDNDGIGEFDYCRVRYGGYSYGNAKANLYFDNSDLGHFANSYCEFSSEEGLKTYNTELLVRNSIFQENTNEGIRILNDDKLPNLGENNLANAGLNNFINNDGGNFQLTNESSFEIDAYYNDWGYYTEAEIDAHIYDDDENASHGQVNFNPWYDASNPPLVAEFEADIISGYDPLTVNFTDQTLYSATSWAWDFENDGVVDATDQNPEWTFQYPGSYTVKLEVSNGTTTDTEIKIDYITVTEPIPMTIADARLEPLGSIVAITGYVTSGNEYGNLHFIQDETAGAGIYDPNITNLRMGDSLLIMGETAEYDGMFELINNTYVKILSRNNTLPEAQLVSIDDLDASYEAEIVRIDNVDFPYGGNSFFNNTPYDIIDPSGTTHFRLHTNSDLKYQRAPEKTVSITGICSHRTDDIGFEYGIYARDYGDLIYTDIQDFESQASGFTKRYTNMAAISAVDENIAWATSRDGKNESIAQEFSRTINGGITWETGIIPNQEGLHIGNVFALDANTAWISSYRYWGANLQGIYKTIDGGVSWTHQSTALFDHNLGGFPNNVYFWDANNGVCMGDPSGGYFEIYSTTDGGNNWSRISQSNVTDPIAEEYGILSSYTVVGNTIWYPTTKGRVFKSIDKGLNWTVVQTPLNDYCILEFKNENDGLLLSQANGALLGTSDGGSTWTQIFYSGDIHTRDLKYIPGTPGSYVITGENGSDAGASYTIDNGQNWFYFPETHGVHFNATDWISPTCGFVGSNNVDESEGGIWKYSGEAIGLYNVSWTPETPLNNQTITIKVGDVTEGAWLHWGVNNWQTPDMAYWPAGTEIAGGGPAVQTMMFGPDENHELTIVLGPFNDLAQSINSIDFVIHYFNETWDNNNGNNYNISMAPSSSEVDLKVYLEGPFNGGSMNTDINGLLPLAQPYNIYPWEYYGGESVTSMPTNVVDWVLVEYRDAADANSANFGSSIGGQAAFVLDDGSIVDLDGVSPLIFDYSLTQNLFVVIWHRNHLPIMSSSSLVLSNGVYTYNFTSAADKAYGDNQSTLGSAYGMIGGDANADGTVNETDGIESWYPFAGQTGYLGGDVNLDTQINNEDKNDIWLPNYNKSEVLPE